jgi:hypothetical protein
MAVDIKAYLNGRPAGENLRGRKAESEIMNWIIDNVSIKMQYAFDLVPF